MVQMPFGGFGIFMDGDILRPLTKQCLIHGIGCGTHDLAIDTSYHWALPSCDIYIYNIIQSTLVISKSKGPSKTVQDIRTSTHQICRIALQEQFLLFSTIFYNLILDFCAITRTRFFLRDKRLFEIT